MASSKLVDAAIAAASAAPAPVPHWQGRVTLGSGREIGLDVPVDITPMDVIHLVAFLTTELPATMRRAEAQLPRSRILIPQ